MQRKRRQLIKDCRDLVLFDVVCGNVRGLGRHCFWGNYSNNLFYDRIVNFFFMAFVTTATKNQRKSLHLNCFSVVLPRKLCDKKKTKIASFICSFLRKSYSLTFDTRSIFHFSRKIMNPIIANIRNHFDRIVVVHLSIALHFIGLLIFVISTLLYRKILPMIDKLTSISTKKYVVTDYITAHSIITSLKCNLDACRFTLHGF